MENVELIDEMVANAEVAPEPGTLKPAQVLDDGKKGDMIPSVVKSVDSAGHVYIYDTQTGEQSVTNKNMLPTQLKKLRPDGSRVFTTSRPNIEVKRGTTKCLLHPDSVDRSHFDELGLPSCKKSNIKNAHELEGHMKNKHKREYETIKSERLELEKQEDRNSMRKLINQLMGKK
jgi:hypothetical protein